MLQQHYDKFAPSDDVEASAIEEMATSLWRLRRVWAIETNLIDKTLAPVPGESEGAYLAAAFSRLAAGPELQLLGRYEARVHRMYQRALNNFLLLQERSASENTGPGHNDNENDDDGDNDGDNNENGGVSPLPGPPSGPESDPQPPAAPIAPESEAPAAAQPIDPVAQKQGFPNEPGRAKPSANHELERERFTPWRPAAKVQPAGYPPHNASNTAEESCGAGAFSREFTGGYAFSASGNSSQQPAFFRQPIARAAARAATTTT